MSGLSPVTCMHTITMMTSKKYKKNNDDQHIIIFIILIILTRPKPAYGRQGLEWIVRPGYSFGVFSMSRVAPLVLSSVDDPD